MNYQEMLLFTRIWSWKWLRSIHWLQLNQFPVKPCDDPSMAYSVLEVTRKRSRELQMVAFVMLTKYQF
jgi:hypothetical protein